jgi:thiopeptide-type bacteriocin biosynthesis protein
VVTAVRAILAGDSLAEAAQRLGADPTVLADAAQAFCDAGTAALHRRAETGCYQANITVPDGNDAEQIMALRIGPRLDAIGADGAFTGWWFLRKHPGWRLRFHLDPTGPAAVETIATTLQDLTAEGVIESWRPVIYEAETAAFGGGRGLAAVHELFCADSRGVLDYLRHPSPPLARRELSVLLCARLAHAAGLDHFEVGDVFDRVARLRPVPTAADRDRLQRLANDLRTLLIGAAGAADIGFGAHGPWAFAAPWHNAVTHAGRQLGDAARSGELNRGLRAVLAQIVIFHWNRLGLSATTQGILARAATLAVLENP